jgi:hypothetical protein
MKLKATVSLPGEHFTQEQRFSLARMVIATNSDEIHQEVYERVLEPHLRIADFGPAEYFTQMTDRMTPARSNYIGFDVTLSGVSVNLRRAPVDFWEGLKQLDEIYRRIAKESLAGLEAQVFTRMALDRAIPYLDRPGETSLLEIGPTNVEGAGTPTLPGENLLAAELEALLGDRRTIRDLFLFTAALGNSERRG